MIDEKTYSIENDLIKKGYKFISGTDEVGRGCIAGPVVAASVIMPINFFIDGVTDSKLLSSKKREVYYEKIISSCICYSVKFICEEVIDEINIYQASKIAMFESIKDLKIKPDYCLIDAMKIEDMIQTPHSSIIKGDLKSFTIACASIIAKVVRDEYMVDLSKKFPEYCLDKNKGYGTKQHKEAIEKYGIKKFHRKTFAPIKNMM